MNTSVLQAGKTHKVWEYLDTTVTEVRKGVTKSRMLTGTYLLQSNKHRFSNYTVDATCQLCHLEDEDIVHMVTRCPALEKLRRQYIPRIKEEIRKIKGSDFLSTNDGNRQIYTKLILDSSWLQPTTPDSTTLINRLSLELCHKLHLERCRLLRV
jgi:hypothetical protein